MYQRCGYKKLENSIWFLSEKEARRSAEIKKWGEDVVLDDREEWEVAFFETVEACWAAASAQKIMVILSCETGLHKQAFLFSHI